jgi:hypothetical protein
MRLSVTAHSNGAVSQRFTEFLAPPSQCVLWRTGAKHVQCCEVWHTTGGRSCPHVQGRVIEVGEACSTSGRDLKFMQSFVGKSEGKKRSRCVWEHNVKCVKSKQSCWGGTHLAEVAD